MSRDQHHQHHHQHHHHKHKLKQQHGEAGGLVGHRLHDAAELGQVELVKKYLGKHMKHTRCYLCVCVCKCIAFALSFAFSLVHTRSHVHIPIIFIDLGDRVNQRDKHWKNTPLMYAAMKGHDDVVRLLLGMYINHVLPTCVLNIYISMCKIRSWSKNR